MRSAITLLFLAATLALAADPPFGDNIRLRGSLDNSRRTFEQTKRGTVAFLGGSITEMNGHRPMVMELLKNRFPDTQFTFIGAGISSTTSITGAFRLDRDVLSKGPVDLLFVEFAVNDDQDGHYTREQCIRGFEGIVRHARQANPLTDIVTTYFVNEPMLATLDAGKVPLTIEAHDAVARHYAVSSLNLAREVSQQIRQGGLTWKIYGGVHPATAGNAIQAAMVAELLARAWASPPGPATPHAIPAPLDPLSFSKGRFIDPAQATIRSGWTLGIPDWKALPGSKRERFTSVPLLSASTPGAELSLAFEGTAIGAFILAGPDAGVAEASIDGGPFRNIELLHEYSKNLHYPRTVLFADDLKPGAHRLTLRVTRGAMRILRFTVN